MKEILTHTLNQMNRVFTSNEFAIKAKRNGISQKQINGGIISSFLHNHATQLDTKRTWCKNDLLKQEVHKKNEIEIAISLLKNSGYKVYKQISTFEEV